MLKVMTFYAVNGFARQPNREDHLPLQEAIDKWLAEEKPTRVERPVQSSSGRMDHHTTITFVYETG